MAGNSIPNPPRLSGEYEKDASPLSNFMADLYKALVLSNEFIKTAGQTETGDFDPTSLPDPGKTNLAQAQDTANKAYNLAAIANTQANVIDYFGELTLSEAEVTKIFAFEEAKQPPDANYSLTFSAKSFTGTPDVGAFIVVQVITAQEQFAIQTSTAPGTGATVTFSWHLRRDTTQDQGT